MSDGMSDAARDAREFEAMENYRRAFARHLLGEETRDRLVAVAAESPDLRYRAKQMKTDVPGLVAAELAGLQDEDRNRKRVAWAKLIAASMDVWVPGARGNYGDLLGRISPFKNSFFILYSQGIGFSNAPKGFGDILSAIGRERGYEAARGRSGHLRTGDHLVVLPKSLLKELGKAAIVQVTADRRTSDEAAKDEADFRKAKAKRRG